MTIKNLRLCPANGGYIVKFDCYKKMNDDEYESERYVGEKKIVFTDGDEAIATLDELFQGSTEVLENMDVVDSAPLPEAKGTDLMKHG